ncbi:MAG: hypothetical protein K2I42_02215 [Anaeroplasmataceae bacterium]|nr:hypothetical protein [Anaeroplasmataceae bacterium]
MKNLFCIVSDYDNKKVKPVYAPFITKELNKSEQKKLSELSKKYENYNLKSKPSKWLLSLSKVLLSLFFVAALFFIVDLIKDINDKEFKTILISNLFYFCAAIVGLIGYVICRVLTFHLAKKSKKTSFKDQANQTFNEILDFTQRCLGVPSNCQTMEVLCEQHFIKKGQLKEKGNIFTNVVLSAYTTKTMLCLADLHCVISIPLASIKEIEKKEEPYRFKSWHKTESIKDKKYEEYKIKSKAFVFSAESYYIFKFIHNEEEYSVLIPPYDYEKISTLLNK